MKSFNMSFFALFLALCLFNSNVYAEIPKYQIVDMGLYGSDESRASSIDEDGTVYGTFTMQGQNYSFVWDENYGLMSHVEPAEDPDSTKDGALMSSMSFIKRNALGQSIYYLHTGIRRHKPNVQGYTLEETKSKAFIKNKDGEMIELGSFEGTHTYASDLNDFGQVVGHSQTPDGKNRAFLWENGKMLDLGTMFGDLGLEADQSFAISINNKGQILGRSSYALVHKGKVVKNLTKSFVYENGKMTILMPDFTSETYPLGISDSGIAFLSKTENAQRSAIAYDINSGFQISIPHPRVVNGNKIISMTNVLYEYVNNELIEIINIGDFFNSCDNYKSYWLKFDKALHFNDNNYIIGLAQNIYGENHAILICPRK